MIGPSIGFRETRKLVGKETITADDVLSRRKREDSVARGGWKPEIHKDVNKMATCFATGHAAGVAVACQALNGCAEVSRVQAELRKQVALV